VSVDGEGIKVLSRDLVVDHQRASKNEKDGPVVYSKLQFRLEGTRAGTNAIVHVSIGSASAMLLVTVGSKMDPPPPPPQPKGGFLRKIEMETSDAKYRAHFDRSTGTLRVNLSHPLQKRYDASRQDPAREKRRVWVVAIADAMTDALFRQVISAYIEEKGKIRRDDPWGKIMNELDVLWHGVGVRVHEIAEAKLLLAD
jgi:hypothetical protein